MQPSSRHFARLAARREPHADAWERCFEELLATGVLNLTTLPGHEYALQIPRLPFTDEPANAALFCVERMLAAGAATQVLFDVSAINAADPAAWLRQFLSRLTRPVALSIAASHAALPALIAADRPQGVVVRFGRGADPSAWQALVATSHSNPLIKPVPVLAGRTLSGLHSPEAGVCAMPLSLFETGADTAWCMLELDATRLGPPGLLRRQLSACLRLADNLLDEVVWPRPALQLDALLNRRVGIHINGLGELLQQRGLFRNSTRAFLWLRRWLNFVRRCLMHESMLLARQRGPFPDLGVNDLIAELAPHYGSDYARRLLRNRFLRHRHLLALSPFALFPADFEPCDEQQYLDLVPVIACADVISMHGPDPRTKLSLGGWEQLLRLTAAFASSSAVIAHNGGC